MPFCTIADITKVEPEANVIQLTDDNGDGVSDAGVVDAAITEADDTIAAVLRGKVTVPSPVPAIITRISRELAICNLYLRRNGNNMPETITGRNKDARKDLADIAAGKIRISDEQSDSKISSSIKTITRERTFDDDTMEQFKNS